VRQVVLVNLVADVLDAPHSVLEDAIGVDLSDQGSDPVFRIYGRCPVAVIVVVAKVERRPRSPRGAGRMRDDEPGFHLEAHHDVPEVGVETGAHVIMESRGMTLANQVPQLLAVEGGSGKPNWCVYSAR
jgi:hypothetical protein